LDIAMGTGQLLFNIAPSFNSSRGIDISDKMLEAAKTLLST
jgi:ubiquinone/menaquinone biosynthesis C-methylase UbiE